MKKIEVNTFLLYSAKYSMHWQGIKISLQDTPKNTARSALIPPQSYGTSSKLTKLSTKCPLGVSVVPAAWGRCEGEGNSLGLLQGMSCSLANVLCGHPALLHTLGKALNYNAHVWVLKGKKSGLRQTFLNHPRSRALGF